MVLFLIVINQVFFPGVNIERTAIYFFVIAFLIDAGHVYTTFLESFTDPHEVKVHHTVWWAILAFILNLSFLVFLPSLFFYYIFYFTVFHNMRQGLGVSFLYQKSFTIKPMFFKSMYYFATLVPFVLFHFKSRASDALGDRIIERLDLFQWFRPESLSMIYNWGQTFYLLALAMIIIYLIVKKVEHIMAFLFFTLVYAVSFLVLNNEIYAYSLLIVSHGIPYFFLMEKRISLTHPKNFIKRNAIFILLFNVVIGALIDFSEDDIYDLTEGNVFVQALFFTPLIAHFLIDGVIWKKGHLKFEAFKKSF